MHKNLEKALRAKGISNNAAAAAINMPEATFRGKMNIAGRSFSIEEAIRIKNNLFPEMEVSYLFKSELLDSDLENKSS